MKTEIEFTYMDDDTFHRVGMVVDNGTGQIAYKLDGKEKVIVGKVWAGMLSDPESPLPDRFTEEQEDTDTGSGDQDEVTGD